MKFSQYIRQFLAMCMLLAGCQMSAIADPGWVPVTVEIRGEPGSYQLYRDGQPYTVRGAGSDNGDLEMLHRHGGNSVRTWHVGDGSILDQAHALGLTVSLCLNVARERHGFDYSDEVAVKKQFEEMKARVLKYRNHPALLTWIIGNELNFDYNDSRVYDAVNDISRMIHEVDPHHPTTTATAGISEPVMRDIRERAPDLDFLSIQVYGMLFDLKRLVDELDIKMPVMVTEWGTLGHWEVESTEWGAPVELTSAGKSSLYRQGYSEVLVPLQGRVIGSYAFLWGQKQERTPTWYGMFTPEGQVTEAVDAIHYIWNDAWPDNRSPELNSVSLNRRGAYDSIVLRAGRKYPARVKVREHDKDPVNYRWLVMEESTSGGLGGDYEETPEELDGLIADPARRFIKLTAPEEQGAYRLYVYVSDDQGATAHANIPFYVIK